MLSKPTRTFALSYSMLAIGSLLPIGCASDNDKEITAPTTTYSATPGSSIAGAAGSAGSAGLAGAAGQGKPVDCAAVGSGDVAFSVPSGTFAGSIAVALSTQVADAEIHFTTDGSTPTLDSPRYDGTALQFTSTTRLRAQAFVNAQASGESSAAIYVARAIDSVHDIPVIVLDAYAQGRLSTQDRSFKDVAFLGFTPQDGTTELAASPSIATTAAYHAHGQSSVMFGKPSFRLELRNPDTSDRNCPVFGLPQDADWVLVGPQSDKTLIHNPFVYSLGRDLGLATPRVALAELFLNVGTLPLASSEYLGVYQVVEKIRIQQNRLALAKLTSADTTEPAITGGYIFKFEWRATELPVIPCAGDTTTCWSDLELVEPEAPNAEQLAYLTGYLQAFNTAIHGPNPSDANTGYPAYIDVASFVDQVIINEFTRNMDAYIRSQYFYKERNGKIVAGPLWDFDLIAGTGMDASFPGESYPNLDTFGWQYVSNAPRMTSDWFEILLADPSFQARLGARWTELRAGLLSDAAIGARIDTLAAGLGRAAERNFARWPILEQLSVMPFTTPVAPTWQGQLTLMRQWLSQRAAWLDSQWH